MARIRSIKPEFWTDGKIKRLPKSSALFFVALWTFADDYGYFTLDTLELSLKAPLWRSQSVLAMLLLLARRGLIRVSRGACCGLIVGWEHQRIKDRRASKYKDLEIKWDDENLDAPGSDEIRPGVERSGEDRKGEDVKPHLPVAVAPRKKREVSPAAKELRQKIWESYSLAYFERYGTEPVRNATVNTQIVRLADRLGDEAPAVVRFYLGHSTAFYVRCAHPIGLCLKDAEGLRTQWATGSKITARQAQQTDDAAAVGDQLQRIREGKL